MIRITSKREGFRRCGVVHSTTPTEHPDDRFTDDELARLKDEPMLFVELVSEEAGGDGKGNSGKGAAAGKNKNKPKPGADGKITGFRITSSVDGFQCAGREWTGVTDVPVADLSEAQVGELMVAPELAVTDILIDAAEQDK